MTASIPKWLNEWLSEKGWSLFPHQAALLDACQGTNHPSALLEAPTGCGKTLSGFLPTLIKLGQEPRKGLVTIYVSPLKALAIDIERNLNDIIAAMPEKPTIDVLTGDTPAATRQKQKRNFPNILLTTPESLMRLLSYKEASSWFATVETVILDEVHTLYGNKRGDFTALALSALSQIKPHGRIGLSATVSEPEKMMQWLDSHDVLHVKAPQVTQTNLSLLPNLPPPPLVGYMARFAVPQILAAIKAHQSTLIFVNTRAQAELLFQLLWKDNSDHLPIALFHGSLSKDQRLQTQRLMLDGQLRAVVSTSALELGIDWGQVDLVIQVGAPKGVSRLMQRIGRANHRFDCPSKAYLVPTNQLEIFECLSGIENVKQKQLEPLAQREGALDVVVQFIINQCCHAPQQKEKLFECVKQAHPYRQLSMATFEALFEFAHNGGYVLSQYPEHVRLEKTQKGFEPISTKVIRRHRQNIGTIVESARIKVRRMRGKHAGPTIGEIEERFIAQLNPGDTFIFAGEVVAFVKIQDMAVWVRPSATKHPKIPSFVGGSMPLSTALAETMYALMTTPPDTLPESAKEWLDLQQALSGVPCRKKLLVEQFPHKHIFVTTLYPFLGRAAHQALGMLLTYHLESIGAGAIGFDANDYGLALYTAKHVAFSDWQSVMTEQLLDMPLSTWLNNAAMTKRAFRDIAVVTGLIEQNRYQQRKTLKQVTFSTDLIFDVLQRYEPEHVLLQLTVANVKTDLLDFERLSAWLTETPPEFNLHQLASPSPMSLSIIYSVQTQWVAGSGESMLLESASIEDAASVCYNALKEKYASN